MPETGNKSSFPAIDLTDESFDLSQTVAYSLSVQLSPNDLTYCLFDRNKNIYNVLRSYRLQGVDLLSDCRSVISNDVYLKRQYSECRLSFVSPRSTLVPTLWADEKDAQSILNFNHGEAKNEQVFSRRLTVAAAVDFFSAPTELLSLWKEVQPQLQVFHHAQTLIDRCLTDAASLALFLYGRYLDVVIVNDGKLLFYNTFEVHYPSEILYFMAASLQRFEMTTPIVTLAGTCDLTDIRKSLTDNGILFVEPAPDKTFFYSPLITEDRQRRYVYLFNLLKCAS